MNATSAQLVYRRQRNSVAYDATFNIGAGSLWAKGVKQSVAIRWTSTAGELGLAVRTHSLFLAGVKVAESSIPTDMPINPGPWVAGQQAPRVYLGQAVSGGSYMTLGGIFSDFEVLPFCLTDQEIARRSG